MRNLHKKTSGASLTTGHPARVLTRLSAPMAIGIIVMMGFNAVDTFFVGQLGVGPLAAMALTFPITMVVISIALGLGISTSIAVSKAIGEGGKGSARLATDGLMLGLVLGLVLLGAAAIWLEDVVSMVGGHGNVQLLAEDYLRIWEVGIPFIMVSIVSSMAVRATGDTLTPGILMVAAISLNAVLDPLLIFGYWGFPRMGISGAALATVLSRLLSLSGALVVLRWRDHLLISPLATWHRLRASYATLLKSAIPIALNNLITPITTGMYTRIVASIGDGAVAGMGVALRIQSLGTTPIYALQSVLGIFVGQNRGAGLFDRVRRGLHSAIRFGLVWGAILFGMLIVWGETLADSFNPEPTVVFSALTYFTIVGISFTLRQAYMVGSAGLNSLGHPALATMITAFSGLLVSIPLAKLGLCLTGQLWGIYCGISIGNAASGLAAIVAIRAKVSNGFEETISDG